MAIKDKSIMDTNKEMKCVVKRFDELTVYELYDMLRLRSEVFVVEQNCVYQDVDNKDQKALHVLGYYNDELCGYTRIFDEGDYFEHASIGRVVTSEGVRKYGFGHTLLKESINAISNLLGRDTIKISAQEYLKRFYEGYGFKQIGEGYLEDDIPHIAMIRE